MRAQLEQETSSLQSRLDTETKALQERLNTETATLRARLDAETSALRSQHAVELNQLQAFFDTQSAEMRRQFEVENAKLHELLESETKALNAEHAEETTSLRDQLSFARSSVEHQVAQSTRSLQSQLNSSTSTLRSQLNQLKAKRLRDVLGRWMEKGKVQPFRAWRKYAHSVRTERVEKDQKQLQAMDIVLRRMANSGKHRALRQWLLFVENSRISQVHSQLTHQLTSTRSHQASAAGRILSRFLGREVKNVFLAWRTEAKRIRMERLKRLDAREAKLNRILVRVEDSSMYSAYRLWLQYVRLHREAEIESENTEYREIAIVSKRESDALKKKLEEQIEITTYLYKVVQNSV